MSTNNKIKNSLEKCFSQLINVHAVNHVDLFLRRKSGGAAEVLRQSYFDFGPEIPLAQQYVKSQEAKGTLTKAHLLQTMRVLSRPEVVGQKRCEGNLPERYKNVQKTLEDCAKDLGVTDTELSKVLFGKPYQLPAGVKSFKALKKLAKRDFEPGAPSCFERLRRRIFGASKVAAVGIDNASTTESSLSRGSIVSESGPRSEKFERLSDLDMRPSDQKSDTSGLSQG